MLYVKVLFQAPYAPSASRIDLELLKDTDRYKEKNSAVTEVAMKKFLGHLWHLSEELLAYAYFHDIHDSNDTKRQMVAALDKTGINILKREQHWSARSNWKIF